MHGTAPAFGGTAVICCVHNRVKRQVTDMLFDAALTKIHLCSCCENVFTERTDTPVFCRTCRGDAVYELGGPLPDPTGAL